MTFTILFVGSGNVGRSVFAAAQTARDLRRIWPRSADEVVVTSAGVDAIEGMPIAPHLETVAERRGFDLTGHTAQPFTPRHAEAADLVLTMTRKQRAQIVLQYPNLRTRTFALLEFLALLQNAAEVRRRQPIGRGDRLEAKLRLVVAAVAARHRVVPTPQDERQWDLFDPYAYSLDIYETVAAALEAASHALVSDIAILTGARGGGRASRTA
jgi:protein-tyrosine phosphatase